MSVYISFAFSLSILAQAEPEPTIEVFILPFPIQMPGAPGEPLRMPMTATLDDGTKAEISLPFNPETLELTTTYTN